VLAVAVVWTTLFGMIKEQLTFHIDTINRLVELGMMDKAQAEAEIVDCQIGLKPCTFSVWMKRPAQLAYKGAWFELYRDITASEVLEAWLMDDINEKEQVRPYNKSQSDLCSKHNQLFA